MASQRTKGERNSSSLRSIILKQTFFQASVLIMFCSFLSKVLGYAREMAIAKYLGATALTDAFFLAQVIPILGAGLITNAFPLAFIPFYLSEKQHREKSAEEFASAVFWGVVFYLLLVSLLIILTSMPLAELIAPGFKGEQLLLTRKFLVFLLPSLFFQGLMGFFTSYLQAQKHFLTPAIGAAVLNAPVVLIIVLLAHQHPSESLILGFNLGYFTYCIIVLPVALYFGFNPLLAFNFFTPLVKRFFILILPIVIGSSLSYIDMLIARAIASGIGEGIVSALNYAYRLMGIPLSMIAGSIGVAVFPFMSSQAVSLDRNALVRETLRSLRATWLVSFPVTVIFTTLSQPLVRVMFERGAFTSEDTMVTSAILSLFALGIPAMTAWIIATRAFYSLKDTITPLKIGFLQIAIDIYLLFILPKFIGYRGLPLATSISISVGFLILWKVLYHKLPELGEEGILPSFVKGLVMCFAQAGIIYILRSLIWVGNPFSLSKNLMFLCILGGGSSLLYLIVGYVVRYPEIDLLQRKLTKIFRKPR